MRKKKAKILIIFDSKIKTQIAQKLITFLNITKPGSCIVDAHNTRYIFKTKFAKISINTIWHNFLNAHYHNTLVDVLIRETVKGSVI